MKLEKEIDSWIRKKEISLFQHQIETFDLFEQKQNILLSSATGTGKSLSAFLPAFNKLVRDKKKGLDTSFYVFYVSPLKALIDDLYINLTEITDFLSNEGIDIKIFKRYSDTNSYQRKKMVELKPDIILTTPESLSLLTINYQEIFKRNDHLIVIDELHSLIDNKRGLNLFLNLTKFNSQKIGLSATIKPLKKISNVLGQDTKIVEGKLERKRNFLSFTPKTKFWLNYKENQKEMYQSLLNEVKKYKCSVIFTNTRSLAESVTIFLKDSLVGEKVLIHHGSLSKEVRYKAQEEMKSGYAKVVVSSTSLELGVDIGYVEHVFQISSPKSITRSLQRLGRSGHSAEKTISGTFLSSTVEETIENSVILNLASKNFVDEIDLIGMHYDVLCQFIISLGYLKEKKSIDEIFFLVKKVFFLKDINKKEFSIVINYLKDSKKVVIENNLLISNERYKKIFVQNLGYIIQHNSVPVFLDNTNIGSVSGEFALNLKKNQAFVISGTRYIYLKSTINKIIVKLDDKKTNNIPTWFSEVLPLNFHLAKEIKSFQTIQLNKLLKKEIISLEKYTQNKEAENSILEHLKEQSTWLFLNGISELNQNDILVEVIGKRIIFHTLYGRKINNCISKIFVLNISKKINSSINIQYQDNGFILDFDVEIKDFNMSHFLHLDEEEAYKELKLSLKNSQLFFNIFVKNLFTCMFLHKNNKENRLEMKFLMHKMHSEKEEHLIIKQTYREIFEDKFDFRRSMDIYKKMKLGSYNLILKRNEYTSPFGMYISISDVDSFFDKHSILKGLREKTNQIFDKNFLFKDKEIGFFPMGVFFNFGEDTIMVVSDLHLNTSTEIYFSEFDFIQDITVLLNFYINLIQPTIFVFLGDIKENITFTSFVEKKYIEKLIDSFVDKVNEIILIKGNHDSNLDLYIKQVDFLEYGDFFLTHGHKKFDVSNYKYILLGHEHVTYDLLFDSGAKKNLKCFFTLEDNSSKRFIILPSASPVKSGVTVNEKTTFLSPMLKKINISDSFALINFENSWFKNRT